MVFFQQCWWVVEVDVMAFFEEFHEHCQFEKSLNASFSSLLFAWRNWFGKRLSTAWNMVPTCLMWLVWKERNTSIFEDKERSLDLLKASLRYFVSVDTRLGFTNCISISEFLHSVSLSF